MFSDTRLLLAARFWTAHADALGNALYEAFWREDLPPLLKAIPGASPDDLAPDELEEIAAFLTDVAPLFPDIVANAGKIQEKGQSQS